MILKLLEVGCDGGASGGGASGGGNVVVGGEG